jgi:NAD(P)-dependent dehydrogenase (short-subunit alcohol dehydrogenase family)
MTTALLAPPRSLAPGLAEALRARGQIVEELAWRGDLRDGIDVGGHDVLVTVAPLPQPGPLLELPHADWVSAIRDIAERPTAAARSLLQSGGGRWIAVIPHLSSQPSPGSGPYGAGGVLLQTVMRVAVVESAARGFCANAVAVPPLAGSRDAQTERDAREDTPTGELTTLDQLADLVHWLATDAPRALNGDTLRLDGGFSITRKPRVAPSPEIAEWLVDEEWRAP